MTVSFPFFFAHRLKKYRHVGHALVLRDLNGKNLPDVAAEGHLETGEREWVAWHHCGKRKLAPDALGHIDQVFMFSSPFMLTTQERASVLRSSKTSAPFVFCICRGQTGLSCGIRPSLSRPCSR